MYTLCLPPSKQCKVYFCEIDSLSSSFSSVLLIHKTLISLAGCEYIVSGSTWLGADVLSLLRTSLELIAGQYKVILVAFSSLIFLFSGLGKKTLR